MSDIDRVFARLGGSPATQTEQRELRSIPRRGASTGSRVVEVVRLPSRGATAGQEQARRPASKVRAETWDEGFRARSATPPSPASPAVAAATVEPVVHVMPMWERTVAEPSVEAAPPAAPGDAPAETPPSARRTRRTQGTASRRAADPFDATDDGANCLRCGYLVEPARERRGLMTCAACA